MDSVGSLIHKTLPCVPLPLAQLIADYYWRCDVCKTVKKNFLNQGYWDVYVSRQWEYNDTLEVSIFSNRPEMYVTLMLNAESGTCDYCSSEWEENAECSVDTLSMVVAHRLSMGDLLEGKEFNLHDLSLHTARPMKEVRYVEHADHAGLELRREVLGPDSDDEDEGDAKEGDEDEGDAKEGDEDEGDANEGDEDEGDANEGDEDEGDN